MAEEKKRDGGRSEPLADDRWRPSARRRAKPFGLLLVYRSHLLGRTYSWRRWYPTPRARRSARTVAAKSDRLLSADYIER